MSTKDQLPSLSGHPQLDHFRHALTCVVAGHGLNVGQSITRRIDQSADLRQLFAFGNVDLSNRLKASLLAAGSGAGLARPETERRGPVPGPGAALQCRLDKAELVANSQLQRVGTRLLRRESKTETSDASLPLPGICVSALTWHRDALKAEGAPVGPDDLLFTTMTGMPVEPRNFNRFWDRQVYSAGARRITVHDARRTCATLLRDLNVHPRVAQRILRHAQVSITLEVYTEVTDEATRDALRQLGESLDE
ncbi:tyrosine-type recombinase/integrase [Catellatospora sp. NPDC049133]|uniref:tyrosine-type recombinase/integrase n=1 Tax=Catellatospora sp. NPDC049133 TaxID=3155499 RepID=UPI0033CBF2A3